MDKKIYDIGIVGLGTVGQEHLRFYIKNKHVNKIYISEIRKIKNYNKKKIIIDSNLSKFKKSKNIKIISISSYDQDHYKKIINFYGECHVFVEKPLCKNLLELKNIFNFVKKTKFKKLLISNLVLREAKIFNNIIDQIKKGQFGKIYYFEGDYLYGRLNKLVRGWRGRDKSYSIMLGGGIHMVDLMIRFLSALPSFVESSSNKIVTSKERFPFNDFTQSTYHFKNGAIGKITSNFGCVHKHQHVIKVYGSKKTFIYDDKGARIYSNRDPSKPEKIKMSKKLYSGKACLLPSFLKKIETSKNFSKNIYNELNLMTTCIFADMSSHKERKLKIKYLK